MYTTNIYGQRIKTDPADLPLTPRESRERFGDFLAKTDTVPRPSANDPQYRFHSPAELSAEQARWDAAKASADKIASWVADNRKQRDDAAQAARDAESKAKSERRQSERAAIEARLRAQFMAGRGATPEAWERVKEEMVDRELVAASTALDEAARRSQAAMLRSF